jgi:arylsulfatase A-like enzyme
MNRRDFIKSIGVGIVGAGLPGCFLSQGKNKQARYPNIIFIMSDDHASHAISAYGSKINETPNIDRLAEQGIRFDNCFCTNSICAPSRAVILTGKYSHLNGVKGNKTEFNGSQQTLPKLLQQAGYQTAIVGKWHLKSPPTGFHYSNVLPGQGAYHDPVMIENGISSKQTGYVTDIITDRALTWLKKQESSTSPFFLMLHHKAPHGNWESDEKHMKMYTDDIALPDTFDDDYKTRTATIKNNTLHVGPEQWDRHFKARLKRGDIPKGLTKQQQRQWVYQKYMKSYLRCVASVDNNVGRVLDYLDRSGLRENTIVVYTSDQGFFLGDHGLYDKRFMYEESLRMPLIMSYPQSIKPSSTSEAMVLNLDFASTLLDYANAPIPKDVQGQSFKAIANGNGPKQWRSAMFYKFYEKAYEIGPHEGVRTKRYKLIHFLEENKGWELYDLDKDPNELNNIYEAPENKKLVAELKATLTSLKIKYKIPDDK